MLISAGKNTEIFSVYLKISEKLLVYIYIYSLKNNDLYAADRSSKETGYEMLPLCNNRITTFKGDFQ